MRLLKSSGLQRRKQKNYGTAGSSSLRAKEVERAIGIELTGMEAMTTEAVKAKVVTVISEIVEVTWTEEGVAALVTVTVIVVTALATSVVTALATVVVKV